MTCGSKVRLPAPEVGYRIDKDAPHLKDPEKFESRTDCKKEDITRVRLLTSTIEKYPSEIDVPHAKRLALQLKASGEIGDYPDSPASSLSMGYFRYGFIGVVWKLFVEAVLHGLPTTFTVIPRTWQFTADELAGVDAIKLMAGFRTDLYAKGAATAGGWLLVGLHGEYDPVAAVFRLHLHGVCSQEMVPVLDGLRAYPRYETRRFEADGTKSAIYRAVRIRRKPPYSLPAPLTYIAQSFWPSRPIFIGEDGKPRRTRVKRRIPEPYHSQVLLWLDRWKIDDLILRVGLRMSRRGLVPTNRRSRRS